MSYPNSGFCMILRYYRHGLPLYSVRIHAPYCGWRSKVETRRSWPFSSSLPYEPELLFMFHGSLMADATSLFRPLNKAPPISPFLASTNYTSTYLSHITISLSLSPAVNVISRDLNTRSSETLCIPRIHPHGPHQACHSTESHPSQDPQAPSP